MKQRHFKSLQDKQKYFDEKHPKRTFMSAAQKPFQFGSSGPSITIGTKFRNEPQIFDYGVPGPGAYQPSHTADKIHHKIQNKPSTEFKSATKNADFMPLPIFTPKGVIKIGELDNLDYTCYNQASSPKFDLGSTLSKKGFSIKPKTAIRSPQEDVPGPGHYVLPSSMLDRGITFSRVAHGNLWKDPSSEEVPGPGAYNVVSFTKPKRWTAKHRVRPSPKSGYVSRPSLIDEITMLSMPVSPH